MAIRALDRGAALLRRDVAGPSVLARVVVRLAVVATDAVLPGTARSARRPHAYGRIGPLIRHLARTLGGDSRFIRFAAGTACPAPPLLKSNKSATGIARGFAPHPFLPVLIESHTAAPRLAWTSEASEFEVDGLPAGDYRVRALDLFGRVTFAAGVAVRPDRTVGPGEHVRLWSKVDLEEPESRQVMGFVRWENGLPVAKAVVFMQNTYNFRKYVRRVETDEQGFFRFVDVPGNEPYFVFALPPGDVNANRSSEHFGVGIFQREVWRDLTLHAHRVTGSIEGLAIEKSEAPSEPHGAIDFQPVTERPPGKMIAPRKRKGNIPSNLLANSLLQLVRIEDRSETIVWTFRPEPSGQFTVSNMPHGNYRVQVRQVDGEQTVRSLPFDIGDGRTETIVRWSSR